MDMNIEVAERFSSYLTDWDYKHYLLLGGYGSGKSYNTALKIILKLLEEKRTALVVREVRETIKESCYSLLKEVLEKLDMLSDEQSNRRTPTDKVIAITSPMEIRFPNGSRIIFRGMDKIQKIKSINGVSIVWIEECSEIKYQAYTELLGRIRQPGVTLHFILTCNPVGRENWVYNTFFTHTDESGKETVICDEKELYRRRTIIKKINKKEVMYYHHSICEDNPFIPQSYIDTLDGLKETDPRLWVVARYGRFGANGIIVLPQFTVATNAKQFVDTVNSIPAQFHFFGLDFGFEESYNALISCCVDDVKKILYIYDEIYVNHLTDKQFADRLDVHKVAARARRCNKPICADSAEPKAIQFYRQSGFNMYGCKKYIGSRLQNTKKIKRFNKIVCSPKCKNAVRELKYLTYAKDSKGNAIYDEFNIDPHTFNSTTKLGVYKTMEKREKLRCQPERKSCNVLVA